MVYKYGFEVARTHAHAMQLDAASGNTKWKDAINTELAQIIEYEILMIKGKERKSRWTINLFGVILCLMSSTTVDTRLDRSGRSPD